MQKLTVVKIGGNIIDNETSLAKFILDFSTIKGFKILIHGGGKLATKLAKDLNIETQLIDGRRITDDATLRIVTMVYAGYINKNIVAQLQANNCNAIGFCGADGNLIKAHKRQNSTVDYGFVGDIDTINTSFLELQLTHNYCPIISPITHDKNGQLLNTNADTIASEIAIAMSKKYDVQFYYCFEKKGLLADIDNDESCINTIQIDEIENLKNTQIITNGMIPKIDNIKNSIEKGVQKVVLCSANDILQILDNNSIFGTTFYK